MTSCLGSFKAEFLLLLFRFGRRCILLFVNLEHEGCLLLFGNSQL